MPRHVTLNPGDRFTKLVVVGMVEEPPVRWRTICDCGAVFVTRAYKLRAGSVKSCGCLRRECWVRSGVRLAGYPRLGTHGLTKSDEYKVWVEMRRRCREEVAYYGRGITVDPRWEGKTGFMNFLQDVGKRPDSKHSIEREDNNGPYSPSNCRWIKSSRQARNRRNTVYLELNGERKSLSDWADHLAVPRSRLYLRYRRGWPPDRILTR